MWESLLKSYLSYVVIYKYCFRVLRLPVQPLCQMLLTKKKLQLSANFYECWYDWRPSSRSFWIHWWAYPHKKRRGTPIYYVLRYDDKDLSSYRLLTDKAIPAVDTPWAPLIRQMKYLMSLQWCLTIACKTGLKKITELQGRVVGATHWQSLSKPEWVRFIFNSQIVNRAALPWLRWYCHGYRYEIVIITPNG